MVGLETRLPARGPVSSRVIVSIGQPAYPYIEREYGMSKVIYWSACAVQRSVYGSTMDLEQNKSGRGCHFQAGWDQGLLPSDNPDWRSTQHIL